LDKRPAIVAIAGPNGAGKTTFFHSHLREAGLRFINADDIARKLKITSYEAAE
jgi:predicted ABC-type ATPase